MTAMALPAGVLLSLGHPTSERAIPPIPQNPIELLKESLEALTLAKYIAVAAFTLVIYDMTLTYQREVQLIWGSRWTFVRVLFTLTRYFIPCVLLLNLYFLFHPELTAKVCKIQVRVAAAVGIFSGAVMMCILLLRVWAIWGRETWMLAILLLVFASSQLPPAALIGRGLQRLEIIDNPLPGVLTGCIITSQSNLNANWGTLYISILTYESTLFALTLLRAWILHRRGVGIPIITLLARDGAWYFLVAIVSVSLTAIGSSIRETQVAALLSHFFFAVLASTCSRLLLRLRGFYAPAGQNTRYEGATQDGDIPLQPKYRTYPRPPALQGQSNVTVYVSTDRTARLDV